jgi:hypothetical protein
MSLALRNTTDVSVTISQVTAVEETMRVLFPVLFALAITVSAFAQIEHRELQGTPVVPTNRLVTSESVNVTGSAANAQQQPLCLHGPSETLENAARRENAIRVMRAINTAQAQAFAMNRAYQNFRELTDSGLPPRPYGFMTQLTVEGSTYALVIKDSVDPCGYTLFSDQAGVIYVGSPLQ